MIPLVVADAVIAAAALVLGALILLREPKNAVYQTFFVFTAGIALSAMAKSFFWWPGDFFARAVAEGGFEIMALGAFLAASTDGSGRLPRKFILLAVPWLFSFLALPAILVVASFRADPAAFFWQSYHGILPITAVIMASYVVFGLLVFLRRRADTFASPIFLMRGLTLVMIVTAAAMCAADLILPTFGVWEFASISNFFALLVILLGGYGIARYGIGGISALRAGMFYFLSLAFVAMLFFGAEIALERSFFKNDGLMDAAAAAIGVLIWLPLRRFFDAATDRIFFRRRHSFPAAAKELGRGLTAATDPNMALAAASGFLTAILRPATIAFFVLDPSRRTVVFSSAPSRGTVLAGSAAALVGLIAEDGIEGAVVLDTLLLRRGREDGRSAIPAELADRAADLGVAAVVPFFASGSMAAVALIGSKLSGAFFTRDDRWYLQYAAERVGGTLEGIALRAAVREQRDTFEERVTAKTSRLREMHACEDRFLADVSHELKTPLAILKMHTAAFAASENDAHQHACRVMNGTLDRMARLIAELLDAARTGASAEVVRHASVDVGDLLRDACDDCAVLAEDRGVALRSSCEARLAALGEKDRLKEVILNLVSNALRHTCSGGSILLTAREAEGEAEIAVSDTGSGIADKDLPHLFERFYSVPAEGSSGTGIGLYLCRRIIEMYGGTIVAKSEIGKGSRFTIRLPLPPGTEVREQVSVIPRGVRAG